MAREIGCIENRLVEFLLHASGRPVDRQTDLVENGLIDSLTMIDLIAFIEKQFNVPVDSADVNTMVFRTPATLARLISARQESVSASETARSAQ